MGPTVPLGEIEWKAYGGSITRQSHPCGRYTTLYIAPDGSRLRSWKTCQTYIREHPRARVSGKPPKSRPKKMVVKSKSKEVDLADESSPASSPGRGEDDNGDVTPQKAQSTVMEQLSTRKSLLEELISSSEEKISLKPSQDKTAVALPASTSKETRGLSKKDTISPKSSQQPASGHKDTIQVAVDEAPTVPKCESGLRDVEQAAGTVNILHQVETQKKIEFKVVLCESSSESELEVTSEDSGAETVEKEEKKKKREDDSPEEYPGNCKKSKTFAISSGYSKKEDVSDFRESCRSDDDGESMSKNSLSRPKRAAAATNFKEKRIRLDETDAKIERKKEVEAEDETTMLMMTRSTSEAETPERNVLDFSLHDGEGRLMQIDALQTRTAYLAGLCFSEGALDKDKGVRCELLGPVTAWSIMGYEKNCVEIVLTTNFADYYLHKPAQNYRRIFIPLYDQARVCREVFRALSGPDGGDPSMGLQDLELRLIRLYNNMGSSGQFFSRDYFHDIGKFVAGQLYALDDNAPEGCQLFTGLRALEELRATSVGLRIRRQIGENFDVGSMNGTSHADALNAGGCAVGDDYELARRLQDEEDGLFDTPMDLANSRPARRGAARQAPAAKGKFYVKINENEIANDYPEPAYYKSDEPETDEYVLFGEDVHPDDEHFPHRFLDDWTLYNSESRLVSLELIPMRPCAENDMQIFGSGVISEDDGSGYNQEDDRAGKSMEQGVGGFRVFLSVVKEWKVEWGSGMIVISFRTDVSWYRLGTPSKQYVEWYAPVLKTAKIAVQIITMLKEQNRVSRLSFNDVVRKLAETEPTWISSKQADVERYVIVHGQIILQQFEEFPDQRIQKCAFVVGLSKKMEQKSHEKLCVSKRRVLIKKEVNLNPRAKLPSSTISKKNKPMRATTSQLVNRVWSEYFGSETTDAGEPRDDENSGKDAEILAEELLEEEDSDDDIVEVIQPPVSLSPPKCTSRKLSSPAGACSPTKSFWKSSDFKVKWGDVSVRNTHEGYPVYKKALFNGLDLTAGKVVVVTGESVTRRFLIEYLFESDYEGPMIHGRLLLKGEETILGDASDERELFLTEACIDIRIGRVKELSTVQMRQRNWGYKYRKENAVQDEADRARAKDRKRKGLPIEYFCRSWWSPEKGAFTSISVDTLALGNGVCVGCETRQESEKKMEIEIFPEGKGFRWHGVEYRINDFLYLEPDAIKDSKPDVRGTPEQITHKGGRNKGLHALIVCQLLSIQSQKTKMKAATCTMKVRRFYRPEDVDLMKAYRAQLHEVYYSEEISVVEMTTVRGKCEVRRKVQDLDTSKGAFDHVFVCDYVHDPKTQTIKHLPANIRLGSSTKDVEATCSRITRAKGKGKARVDEEIEQPDNEAEESPALATLDIFAGCGGLSEGLHESGVSVTKWAIEYDREAAEAFKMNHPLAEVFCDNCNVVLRAIMERGGDLDDCLSHPEADELCTKMEEDVKAKLPVPGEVDFINGGPPCQGFSGMNRFNQRAWSKVQCEMILAFLSYADYYRPRYFLLENVRNFVTFNKGQTFRLTVASLLEMGYQVRFGVLQAGNFGVAQSRKRAFIWAAGPDEILPEWPEPRHVFSSSQLGITLPGGGQYAAVRDAGRGAPFRPITVRDAIADLPAVVNGADTQNIVYSSPAESWFQKQIRGDTNVLTDHISKEMNELNLIRCQRIPKRPGADWRDLPDEKIKLSTGQVVDLIPWCLPNTAARHNQWKGLFGRLDWDGNFPTSVTDPQPMGKVGMCFHPVQNRIVTVRECARSQGFPDRYKFSGNIICKHRQIGNAVPPPLACALGCKLKEAINSGKQM